jgi:hypothetical protein
MGGLCDTYGILEKSVKVLVYKPEGKNSLRRPRFIQDVPGGMCQTSGECSLC